MILLQLGICAWSVWGIPWRTAVYGLWRVEERLQSLFWDTHKQETGMESGQYFKVEHTYFTVRMPNVLIHKPQTFSPLGLSFFLDPKYGTQQ